MRDRKEGGYEERKRKGGEGGRVCRKCSVKRCPGGEVEYEACRLAGKAATLLCYGFIDITVTLIVTLDLNLALWYTRATQPHGIFL